MRNLATVQQISKVVPLEGYDKIHYVSMKDNLFKVLAQVNIQPEDLVVYGEIDSIFPVENELFSFLEGKRIRAKKMAGVVSQGIVFPISVLPPGDYKVGDDVTELLGITKYEPDVFNRTSSNISSKSDFHPLIPKTDETRFQTYGKVINNSLGTRCYITEKVDGSSFTFVKSELIPDKPKFYSRNQSQSDDSAFGYIYHNVIKPVEDLIPNDIAIQGEILGPGIQNNKYKLKDYQLKVFSVYDIKKSGYYDYKQIVELCQTLGLQMVPVLNDNFELHNNWDELEKLSMNKSKLNPQMDAEGIVIRELISSNNLLSFKIINPNFLLKN